MFNFVNGIQGHFLDIHELYVFLDY